MMEHFTCCPSSLAHIIMTQPPFITSLSQNSNMHCINNFSDDTHYIFIPFICLQFGGFLFLTQCLAPFSHFLYTCNHWHPYGPCMPHYSNYTTIILEPGRVYCISCWRRRDHPPTIPIVDEHMKLYDNIISSHIRC